MLYVSYLTPDSDHQLCLGKRFINRNKTTSTLLKSSSGGLLINTNAPKHEGHCILDHTWRGD